MVLKLFEEIETYKVVPPSYKLVYNPHKKYRYIYTINPSEIGVI